MGLENTITEQDLDAASQEFVQGFRNDGKELEPDLAVDGLSESIIAKLIRLIPFRRSCNHRLLKQRFKIVWSGMGNCWTKSLRHRKIIGLQ